MNIAHAPEVVGSTAKIRRLFVALELSKSTWVVAIQPPAVDKVSLFRIPGGDIERLFVLLDQARRLAVGPIELCACY
jgi:transposase